MKKMEVLELFERNVLSINGKDNENEIQDFLEENTDLIPTPFLSNHRLHFDSIISKFKISDEYICDLAYLTKSSVDWELILIELESSNKPIFNKSNKNITFSAKFNYAWDQVSSWKAYVSENRKEIKEKLKYLMGHMYRNSFSVKFVLVIGRSSEIDTEEKAQMFAEKSQQGVKVMTYDGLINYYKTETRNHKNILTKVKNGFSLEKYNTSCVMFAHLKSGNLSFNKNIRDKLTAEGYDLDSWDKGELLVLNNKYPLRNFRSGFTDYMLSQKDD